jgi:hypothetical protein
MHVEDFARQYGTKTNEELLRLARDLEHLTPEASVVTLLSALSASDSWRHLC